MGLIVGIDASRNRSGGSRLHLRGILEHLEPSQHGIDQVHVWGYAKLLDLLPNVPWLVKHNPPALERSLPHQVFWQATQLARDARRSSCDILYVTDASTVGRFSPMVVLSQDLLSYEPGLMRAFGWSPARLRLWLIRLLQNSAFRAADGVIFLTRHSQRTIMRSSGPLRAIACIPHGVDEIFRAITMRPWPESRERPIECVYVSNAALYKNQWHVIRAVAHLRREGHALRLVLIGGGRGRARDLMETARQECDPGNEWIETLEYLPHVELPSRLAQADLFIFASACEAFGITLLEAMAAGLPIACSNRSSVPEVAADAGVLFDPESPAEIAHAVRRLLIDSTIRQESAAKARLVAAAYSWPRSARATWNFVVEVAHAHKIP